MTAHITINWLITVFLLSIRCGVVLVVTPILGSIGLPIRVRVFLVLAFAIALVSALQPIVVPTQFTPSDLILAALNELFWGGLLAFGLLAAFSAFMVGGRILDMQIGFGLANLVDPTTRTNAPLLGVLLHLYAIAWFLAADAHHAVLRGLAKSFKQIPLGSRLGHVPLDALIQHFGLMFSLGLVLVAAAFVCLLLVDVGMGVASRILPQANVFILSFPVKIFVGLSTLTLATLYIQPVMRKIFDQVFNYWDIVLTK